MAIRAMTIVVAALFRDVPLRSRRPGPSRSLLLPCWTYCSVSLLRCPTLLPSCLAAEHGNGLRRPRLPSGRTLVLDRVRRAASLRLSARASPRFLSLHYTSSRLASSRVLATSARERLVYRFGFRSNYLQRCSRAGEKHVDRGRSVLRTAE